MAYAINGPHFCISAHMMELRAAFERLRLACDASGGTLSRADLDETLNDIERQAENGFDRFEKAFQTSTDTHQKAHGRRFDASAGARFALFTACHYAIDEAFASQRAQAPREWAMVVCEALIDVGEAGFAPDFREKIWSAYKSMAFHSGAALDVASFAAAPEIRTVTRAFIGGLLQEMDAHTDHSWLMYHLNSALCRKFKIGAPHGYLINGRQMKVFNDRLWHDLAARLA